MNWTAIVAREFARKRLTPQLALVLAEEAFKAGRRADSERLLGIALELFDFAAAHDNRE